MRRARWSELVFAVMAFFLSIGLPVPPPDNRALLVLAHWYGMVAVAFGLVVALRRPSRPVWAASAALSAYFLLNVLAGLRVWLTTLQSFGGLIASPGVVLSNVFVAIVILAQVDVASRCWRSRALWTERTMGPDEAPVA